MIGKKQYYPIGYRYNRVGPNFGLTAAQAEGAMNHAANKGDVCTRFVTQYYWLRMNVPFTGTVGENVTASTDQHDFDILIKGIWSDLRRARWRLVQSDADLQYMPTPDLITTFAGRWDRTFPIYWLLRPIPIKARNTLKADFINSGGESVGRVIFAGEKVDAIKPYQFRYSTEYRLPCDLTNGLTASIDHDFLIWGASAWGVDPLATEIRIIEQNTNFAWSNDLLPISAFAGTALNSTTNAPEITTLIKFPKPILLPKRIQLKVESNTGQGFITFIGERILG